MKHTNQPLPTPEAGSSEAPQRFVAYYRVSTDKQGRSGLGLDAQREAVNRFVVARAATVVTEFVEIESGGKDDRPKLKEALAVCKRGKATLLIAKLDRLARNVAFVAGLMDGDMEFVAVDMPHASRFMLHIMAAVAEHERLAISERTRAALAAAKARGVRLGKNGARLAKANKDSAFCFAADMRVHVEAAIAADASTPTEISGYFNRSGIMSREGRRWYASSVRRLLQRLAAGAQAHLLDPQLQRDKRKNISATTSACFINYDIIGGGREV